MKTHPSIRTLWPLTLCLAAFAQNNPAPAVVEGVKGVRQEGSGKVREIDPAAKNVAPTTVQGVEKVDGVKTPDGAKMIKETPPPAAVPPPTQKAVNGVPQTATPVEPPAAKGTPPPPAVKGAGTKGTPPPPVAEGTPPPPAVTGAGTKGTLPPPVAEGTPPPPAVKGAGTKGTPPPPVAEGTPPPPVTQGTPPPPTAKGVEKVEGVHPPEAVKPAAGGIMPVQGVTGIGAVKQQNLEAALQVKPAAKPDPKTAHAAAALLGGPAPVPKGPEKDARIIFEEAKKIPDNGS